MKLSIITINYNNIDGLKKTVDSVMSQSWRDFEWIIIDGGSTDGSKEVIEELAKNPLAKITYWCSEPDGGIYPALNKGVKYANGEYVNFMNAGDCFMDENVLYKVYSINHSSDVLYGNTLFYNDIKQWIVSYPKELSLNWICHESLNHQSTFIRRDIFFNIQFDSKYKVAADRKFWMQCMLNGYSFKYVDEVIARYDFMGFSAQNVSKWKDEQKKIYEEIVPIGIKYDLERSSKYELFENLPFISISAEIMRLGNKTCSMYVFLSKIYFKVLLFMRNLYAKTLDNRTSI